MGSRRADRPNARSHARPKTGLRARSAVLAIGVITVTAGVGVTLATGGGDEGGASRVETNAAGDAAEAGGEETAASPSLLASPSPSASASASPSPSVTASAAPKRAPSPTASTTKPRPRTTTQAATGAPTGGDRPASSSGGSGSGTSGGSGGSDPSGPEAQVLSLVNKERASAGCSPLTANAKLTQAADDYSDVMARSGVMSHTGPDGSTMTSRVEAAGYVWSTLGENIARGQADAASVMNSWMNSPGHRANILNCSFKELGVGVHFGDGGPWWTQNFGAGR
ncbi:CAP domain-containing protein [Streptomyces sp. Tu 2975]|uniref:CAP domain-containing protein n=1 Tax=Streptomyces sp. Tu 2975 TaxID=2676871 RepID=UPI0013584B3C|nr:CAP domain-containing protein [Streptomyces sp. Tu 2975]QIP83880.1 CAP domain-containing protein [Streptomyces sp. Tu 2975]